MRIRVLGFGWSEFSHPWSKNGVEYSPQELYKHLKGIISDEKKRTIPNKPPAMIPQRKQLSQLGEQTSDVKVIDATHKEKSVQLDHNARMMRIDRESIGQGDRYEKLQPTLMPKIERRFIGTRLDVCFDFELDTGGKELRWCQGSVKDISNGSNMLYPNARSKCYKEGETVMIIQDAINGISDAYESIQHLPKSKWNKQSVGAWRLDVELNS